MPHKKPCNPRRVVSVRRTILVPICLMLVLQLVVLLSGLVLSRLVPNINRTALDALAQRTAARKNYLQSEMLTRWSNVDAAVSSVNALYEKMRTGGVLEPATLSTSPQQYNMFLKAAGETLVSALRANATTGAFLILGEEMPSGGVTTSVPRGERTGKYPALYVRDLDPVSRYSAKNGDLLLEYAPMEVVSSMGISTDTHWRPLLVMGENEAFAQYLQQMYHTANTNRNLNYRDLGRWSAPYKLADGTEQEYAVAYAVPLVAEDGTLYGILGVEMLLTQLRARLPYGEMDAGTHGTYVLGVHQEDAQAQASGSYTMDVVLANGAAPVVKHGDAITLVPSVAHKGYYTLAMPAADTQTCAAMQPLVLYNTNTPFANEQWALVALMPVTSLYALSAQTMFAFGATVLFMICSSLCAVLLVVRVVSRPIIGLAGQVRDAPKTQPIVLDRAHIAEVDALAEAVEELSCELYRSAGKFTEIVEMSSTSMGGFEANIAEKTLFVNHGFFATFGMPEVNAANMTLDEFKTMFDTFVPCLVSSRPGQEPERMEYLFRMPGHPQDSTSAVLWVRLRVLDRAPVWVGLVEDVTREQMDKEKLAYERDHDVLTGLYNRRAFQRIVEDLFRNKREMMRCGALLMLDLDNLKYVNDTYGHDTGDQYIHMAAAVLRAHTDENALLARMSGDEFMLFLYGCDARVQLERKLTVLQDDFRATAIPLPTQGTHPLRASGGVAWYPTDSLVFDELKRYADFAMYKVKNSTKGEFCDFDLGTYRRDAYLLQSKEALNQLLEQHLVEYHFQPIVDVRSGEVYAYEALMRPRAEGLTSPDIVLRMARQESKLAGVERMTWFCALKAFAAHRASGAVPGHCKLFLNSIANQVLSEADIAALEHRFAACLPLVVQEHTEEEQTDAECQRIKADYLQKWGAQTALDDYGSGYNGDKVLLSYTPDYIKLDRCLITDIEETPYKQQLVYNLIELARTRGIRVIAEGVETRTELEALIAIGVDYVQGYYLARPALHPPVPTAACVQEIVYAQALKGAKRERKTKAQSKGAKQVKNTD